MPLAFHSRQQYYEAASLAKARQAVAMARRVRKHVRAILPKSVVKPIKK